MELTAEPETTFVCHDITVRRAESSILPVAVLAGGYLFPIEFPPGTAFRYIKGHGNDSEDRIYPYLHYHSLR